MSKKSKFVRINKLFLVAIISLVAVIAFWMGGKAFMLFHTTLAVDHYETYVVRSDDTLSEIASMYKMDDEKDYRRQMHAIREENGINADCDIYSGQILQIPVFIEVVC